MLDSMKGMKELTPEVQNQATKAGLTASEEKAMIVKIEKWYETEKIKIDDKKVELVNDFCYLRSLIRTYNSCQREMWRYIEPQYYVQ